MKAVNRNYEVISCHAPGVSPRWLNNGTSGVTCSACNSVHPDEFVRLINAGEFICGFMWEGTNEPIWASLGGYRFYALHLQEMSVEWMHEHAMTIFKATGVLFYWDKEFLVLHTSSVGVRMGRDSIYRITAAQIAAAQELNDLFYYYKGNRKV